MVVIDLYYRADSQAVCLPFQEENEPSVQGLIFRVVSSGHANLGTFGHDLACASISAVLTAFAGAVVGHKKIGAKLKSRGRGHLDISINDLPSQNKDWLVGLESGLVCGLSRIKKEFPEAIQICLHRDQIDF